MRKTSRKKCDKAVSPWVHTLYNGNAVHEIENTHTPLRLGGMAGWVKIEDQLTF